MPELHQDSQTHLKVATLADFTPDFLIKELKKQALLSGFTLDIYRAHPANFEAEILDETSDLYKFKPDRVLIALSGPIQWENFMQLEPFSKKRASFYEDLIRKLAQLWEILSEKCPKVTIWQTNLTHFPDGLWGNNSPIEIKSFSLHQRNFNLSLRNEIGKYANINLLDWETIAMQNGCAYTYDTRLWVTSSHPFNLDVLKFLADSCVSELQWEFGRVPKVVVLDLDNTLWGDEVGDRGSNGVILGQEGFGRSFRVFQLWLQSLKSSGILLAIASHNDPEPVKEIFKNNSEMILKYEDFASVQIGWQPKSSMIYDISKELNVGTDTIVFFDDSAFVRNEVRSKVPCAHVPELPEDHSDWIPFLAKARIFQSKSTTDTDKTRTEFFHSQKKRKENEDNFPTYQEYLQSLEMKASVEVLGRKNLQRAFQLVQRTNQFNLRTIRYSQKELSDLSYEANLYCRLFGLRDIYGEYGIVSFMIIRFNRSDQYSAFLDTWVMSCRVFQRGFEKWILNAVAKELSIVGIAKITTEWIPTNKNKRMHPTLIELGWQHLENNIWCLDLHNYQSHSVHINHDRA